MVWICHDTYSSETNVQFDQLYIIQLFMLALHDGLEKKLYGPASSVAPSSNPGIVLRRRSGILLRGGLLVLLPKNQNVNCQIQ